MDKDGLIQKIYDSAERINQGRRWLFTDGLESQGRVSYKRGLETAMYAFQIAFSQAGTDLESLILAEQAFVTQELHFCDSSETQTISSLEQAIRSFDDALRSLEVVANSCSYIIAEKTHPTGGKYRHKGMPKDAFHLACIGHRTRIGNILRTPGINHAERVLFVQRVANMSAAQGAYYDMQKEALGTRIPLEGI